MCHVCVVLRHAATCYSGVCACACFSVSLLAHVSVHRCVLGYIFAQLLTCLTCRQLTFPNSHSNFLRTSAGTYLPACLPAFLPTYQHTCPRTYLPTIGLERNAPSVAEPVNVQGVIKTRKPTRPCKTLQHHEAL